MPFLRVSRDQRGYETTFLLHAPLAGARPVVLYWFRSAPGVRVGRAAFDEETIRAIEERHPELEFDWPHILEASTMFPTEPEPRQERPRRRPPRAREDEPQRPATASTAPASVSAPNGIDASAGARPAQESPAAIEGEDAHPSPVISPQATVPVSPAPQNRVLDDLVGREIASRLRTQYLELSASIARLGGPQADALRARAALLDPDQWLTPARVMQGIEHAETRADELRRDVNAALAGVSSQSP